MAWSKHWRDYWPALEREIIEAQPRGKVPRVNGKGWVGPVHSPLREDHTASFSYRPPTYADPTGAWKDHGTGEASTLKVAFDFLTCSSSQAFCAGPSIEGLGP